MPLLSLVIAYLLGSIPFGYLIVRLRAGADIREVGSGGTGATNVTRRVGKGAGAATLVLDALKGVAAVVAARWLAGGGEEGAWVVAAAAVMAVVGHIFPVWLGFRGGKGVATGLGVFLALAPLAVLAAVPIFLLVVWQTRYVSLGSIVTAATAPLWAWLWYGVVAPRAGLGQVLAALAVTAALIIAKHGGNMRRLRAGTESKFQV
jgi:acyl phosphate:glycerol-3-phosphate acyltransferase